MLLCMADLELKRKFEELEKVGLKQRLYRLAVLSAVDEAWIEQVDYLQQLTCMISGRSLAQRDPIVEYNKEAYLSFEKMKKRIRLHSVRNLYLSEIRREGESIRLLLP